MHGYQLERKDRDQCRFVSSENGGGVLMYIANHVNYNRRHDLESNKVESIWLEIKLRNTKSFLVCSVYRPPSAKVDWVDSFAEEIDKSLADFDEIYIMGDINFDAKNGIISNKAWKQVTELNDLHQIITSCTRVTAHSETLIDHVYATCPGHVAESFVPHLAVSDHYPVCFTKKTTKKPNKTRLP